MLTFTTRGINVADGMRAMYERPWTAPPSGPAIVSVTGATLRRAVHRDGGQAIEFDLAADSAPRAPIRVGFGSLATGRLWRLRETGRDGGAGRSARIPIDDRGQALIAAVSGAGVRRFRLEAVG